MRLGDCFAEHVPVGHDYTAKRDVAFGENEIFLASLADDTLELFEPGARADYRESIIAMNHGRIRRGDCFGAVAHACNCDARFDSTRNRINANAIKIRIRDDECAALQRLDRRPVLFRERCRLAQGIDAEDLFEQQQRSDDADDRHRISDGVTKRGQSQAIGRDVRQRAERLGAGAE